MNYDDAQLVDRDDPVDDEGRCRLCKRPWPAPPEDEVNERDDD
jgi:hypothetical protein